MPSAVEKKVRPKYLSLPAILFQIRLPLPARVSILHRISGAWLVFPFAAWLLYLLDQSLASEQGFAYVKAYLQLPLVKAGMLVFIWSLCHHFCAGIRHLLLDVHVGIALSSARWSSVAVIAGGLLLTAFFGAALW
jgi:succinate dehydrogenase / fumarate reductase cytochrome b subunit